MITVIENSQARAHLLQSLAMPTCSPWNAVRCELLRSLMWALTQGKQPVHVIRLLNCAVSVGQSLCDTETQHESLRETMRDSLEALSDSGDAVEFPNGLWMPAVCRVVRFDGNALRLLVGGIPSRLASTLLNTDLTHHGAFRHIPPASNLASRLPIDDFCSWASLPHLALSEWAKMIKESVERVPYTPMPDVPLEHYAPEEAGVGAPQFKRWTTKLDRLRGVRLARKTRIYGAREYRLIEISRGRVTRAGTIPIGDVRRYMYAMDIAARNPVSVHVREYPDGCEVMASSEFPRAEQRLFGAIGTLSIPQDKPYRRHWFFADHRQFVDERLAALGIETKTSTRKTRQ